MRKKNPLGGFNYLGYAVKRFGFADGVCRWWKYEASPMRWPGLIRDRIKEYRLIDRREKCSYAHRSYAVDRDGDMYLIECPVCHQTQSVTVYLLPEDKPCHNCGKMGETHFHCYHCSDFGFNVYLEDGLREILDHRTGNLPNPGIAVRDDQNKYRMGIDADAPWWWRRYEIYYDFNSANGKDAHGHKPYVIWSIDPEWIEAQRGGMQEDKEKR
jgi:hypothetical protein